VEKLTALLRQTEFHLILFFLCLIFFGWPVVSFPDVDRLVIVYKYLFGAWAAVIVVLYLMSRSQDVPPDTDESDTSGQA
jgi:hypothetical protein